MTVTETREMRSRRQKSDFRRFHFFFHFFNQSELEKKSQTPLIVYIQLIINVVGDLRLVGIVTIGILSQVTAMTAEGTYWNSQTDGSPIHYDDISPPTPAVGHSLTLCSNKAAPYLANDSLVRSQFTAFSIPMTYRGVPL